MSLSAIHACINISIHVPAWGTTVHRAKKIYVQKRFQSTFPRGERPYLPVCGDMRKGISIHVPAWGTTKVALNYNLTAAISIHVPAWGTTFTSFSHGAPNIISIHVPAWGTTSSAVNFCVFLQKFQSTFPRGERLPSGLFLCQVF